MTAREVWAYPRPVETWWNQRRQLVMWYCERGFIAGLIAGFIAGYRSGRALARRREAQ